jgi:hypothetical protein
MHFRSPFESPFHQFCIDKFPDERGRQMPDSGSYNLSFNVSADIFRSVDIHIRFTNEGIDDLLSVPTRDIFARSSDKKGQIRRFFIMHMKTPTIFL